MPTRPTVLHVDDDPALLDLSTLSFERSDSEKVETVTASNAEEGLEVLESRSVDCIVSDSLRLADDTAFIVAARQRNPATPILFYTAKEWDTVALDALEARVSEYVRKADDGDIEAVVQRASELAAKNRTPTIEEGELFDGRPCETVEEAVERFPAEIADDTWTVIGVHDWERGDELGTTIVQVMGAYSGIDPLNAEPLFTSLDAEALESLLEPTSGERPRYDMQVRFPYAKWELSVSSGGFVAIRELPETGDE